eukprot:scaffold79081_cov66-Phaeocystis_antarctica.AAC.5
MATVVTVAKGSAAAAAAAAATAKVAKGSAAGVARVTPVGLEVRAYSRPHPRRSTVRRAGMSRQGTHADRARACARRAHRLAARGGVVPTRAHHARLRAAEELVRAGGVVIAAEATCPTLGRTPLRGAHPPKGLLGVPALALCDATVRGGRPAAAPPRLTPGVGGAQSGGCLDLGRRRRWRRWQHQRGDRRGVSDSDVLGGGRHEEQRKAELHCACARGGGNLGSTPHARGRACPA